MIQAFSLQVFLLASLLLTSCSNDASESTNTTASASTTPAISQIKEDSLTYADGSTSLKGYIYYDSAKSDKRPGVLVVPEWWGLTEYPRMRARQLAEMGYIAMAVDMYGNGKLAADPKEAQALAMPFYTNPQLFADRLAAAEDKLKTYAQADADKMAAIGYCFGGSAVLNAARLGADYKGVVSFHGDFPQGPVEKNKWKGAVLIAHGEADQFVSTASLTAFAKRLDSVGVQNTVRTYPGATHAFTNPAATKAGQKFRMPIEYNRAADTASWNEMKAFFGAIFK
ncbi:MAG: dienelactone hydrolase [Flaviaesturariibacter sp.]|nr:dienelactone hydrolase [Flaviaesturariibacter sp.]